MAGIEASMITSLGTCRLVMPRSESTIASVGPAAISASKAALISAPFGQRAQTREDGAEAVVRGQAGGIDGLAVLRERLREEGSHRVTEDDRVGDLHHRRLEVHGEQHVLGLGPRDLRREEVAQLRRRA